MHIMYMYIDQSHACMGITFICLYISSCRCEHATTVFRENSEVKRVKLAKKPRDNSHGNGMEKTPYLESEIHLQMVHVIIAMLGCSILSVPLTHFVCLSSIYLRLLKEVFRFSPIFLLKLFSKKNNQPL